MFKIFYDLTLYLKFECPLLNYFTTTPLIDHKQRNGQPFRRLTCISLCLEV